MKETLYGPRNNPASALLEACGYTVRERIEERTRCKVQVIDLKNKQTWPGSNQNVLVCSNGRFVKTFNGHIVCEESVEEGEGYWDGAVWWPGDGGIVRVEDGLPPEDVLVFVWCGEKPWSVGKIMDGVWYERKVSVGWNINPSWVNLELLEGTKISHWMPGSFPKWPGTR